MTTEPTLGFGIDKNHKTAWGARAILHQFKSVELLPDRQSSRGPRKKKLAIAMNAGPLEDALEVGKSMSPRDYGEKELYRGEGIVIVGNARASHGYLYLGAWFEDEE